MKQVSHTAGPNSFTLSESTNRKHRQQCRRYPAAASGIPPILSTLFLKMQSPTLPSNGDKPTSTATASHQKISLHARHTIEGSRSMARPETWSDVLKARYKLKEERRWKIHVHVDRTTRQQLNLVRSLSLTSTCYSRAIC